MTGRRAARAYGWLMPILLLGSLLSFSRGAWINLAVSLALYACLSFTTVATLRGPHDDRRLWGAYADSLPCPINAFSRRTA